jgi:2-polyprenyl-3-methyl-5-hydroxy-6-metoxy-1,4-benzoquinol methylase
LITTIPAANLVKFAQVSSWQKVLDVACGAGVVAVTAARRGAIVSGLDLSPVLLERARYNAELAGVTVDFAEGDAEALPIRMLPSTSCSANSATSLRRVRKSP